MSDAPPDFAAMAGPERVDPTRAPLERVLSGFDELARAILDSAAPDKYHRLKRCAEQAANARCALGAESLRDFADGGPGYAGDGVDGGFLRPAGLGFVPQVPPVQDVYREIIGLAKPYLDAMLEVAKARSAAAARAAEPDPMDWTYEVERLSRLRHQFESGSDELKAVDLRIRDLTLRSVRKPGDESAGGATMAASVGEFLSNPKEAAPCPSA